MVEWFGHLFPGGGCVPGVAYVPAVPVYYPFLSVRDVVEYRCARETTGRPARHAVEAALLRLGLDSRANCQVASLSREEVARLSIAEVLSFDPEILLVDTRPADEYNPLSDCALDALGEHASSGGAVIVTARHVHSIVRAASRVIVLDEGKISKTYCADQGTGEQLEPFFPRQPNGARFVAERMH
jgi:ABC-type multidrug transport system ATPase subunit